MLNLAPRTIRKRIAAGLLRSYKDGRAVRIPEEALAEYRERLMEALPRVLTVYRHLGQRRRRMA